MPVYLLHGFRWRRPLIRYHIIMENIDDAAPEWLMAPGTAPALLDNFHQLYPEAMASLPIVRFVEQYDPLDTTVSSQPYAYVADIVHEIKLGVDIDEIRAQGAATKNWDALANLRDALCKDKNVPLAWYVVVCGDEERDFPRPSITSETGVPGSSSYKSKSAGDVESSQWTRSQTANEDEKQGSETHTERSSTISRGLRKVFGMNGSMGPKKFVPDHF